MFLLLVFMEALVCVLNYVCMLTEIENLVEVRL